MKNLLKIIVVLFIGTYLQASDLELNNSKIFGTKTALIVINDIAGLNNYNSNRKLFKQNITKYNELVTKQNLRKMRVSSIAYYTYDEQVRFIGKIESTKVGKLFRESKKIMDEVILELKQDQSNKAKGSINLFHFVNNLINQSYSDYQQITILIFSNLRDTITTKEDRKNIEPIRIDNKVSLHLYAASGLEAIKGVSTMQKMNAEASIITFYTNLLSTSNVVIKTMY